MPSAIVVTYNNIETIVPLVQGLLVDGIDVVAVDNGSDDGTAEYLKKERHIRSILNSTNLGSSVARNLGISACHGPYLLIDGDIGYLPGSFRYLMELLSLHSVACVGFDPYCCTADQAEIWPSFPPRNIDVEPGWIAYTQYGLFSEEVFSHCLFDESYGFGWGLEDDDLFLQMCSHQLVTIQIRWQYYHRRHSSLAALLRRGIGPNYVRRSEHFERKWGKAYVPGLGRARTQLNSRQLMLVDWHMIGGIPLPRIAEFMNWNLQLTQEEWASAVEWLHKFRIENADRIYSPREKHH